MVASNELNPDYFIETADMLIDLIIEIYRELKIQFEFMNMGGGIGIPYKPEDKEVDIEYISEKVKNIYNKKIANTPLEPLKIFMENGRMITGPHGYLITKVINPVRSVNCIFVVLPPVFKHSIRYMYFLFFCKSTTYKSVEVF